MAVAPQKKEHSVSLRGRPILFISFTLHGWASSVNECLLLTNFIHTTLIHRTIFCVISLSFPFAARQRHIYTIRHAYFHIIISYSKTNPFLTNLVRETSHSLTISTCALMNTNPPHVLRRPDMCSYNWREIRTEFWFRSLVQSIHLEGLFGGASVI